MKAILITQKNFHKTAAAVMRKFTDDMEKSNDKYEGVMELNDVLTISIVLGLLESELFDKGGENSEQ